MADAIFYGGDILSVSGNPSDWELGVVAVTNGLISAVGTSLDDVASQRSSSTKLVDLQGATLLPGFIEPHSHPFYSAMMYNQCVDVSGLEPLTKDEAWAKIEQALEGTPKGGTVRAWSFNSMLVPGMVFPTLSEMDTIAPDRKLVLVAQGSHSLACNSQAFAAAGVTPATPDPEGGAYLKDKNNNLTGVCLEAPAVQNILRSVDQPSDEVVTKFVKRQMDSYAKHGYTTVAGLGIIKTIPRSVERLRSVASSSECPVRIVVYLDGEAFVEGDDEGCGASEEANYKVVGIKHWADGSPYSGTIAINEPFLDTPLTRELGFPPHPNRGILNFADDALHGKLLKYHLKGFQLAVHTHGERAVQQTLDAYEKILQEHPKPDHRYRLEHCGLITEEQLKRAKQMGVSLSFYPDHIHFFGPFLREGILGPERAARFMPLKSALDAGHEFTLHSDTPCTPLGVMRNFKTAVTRVMRAPPLGAPGIHEPFGAQALGPEQSISVDDVIRCYTINAAKQIFYETCLGSIEVGKIADFTIISKNPRKIDSCDLDKIEILGTYRSGQEAKLYKV